MKPKPIYVDLQESCSNALRRAGLLTSNIAVSVDGDVITLTGFVDSYSDKVKAGDALKALRAVHGIANDIRVREVSEETDQEIVKDVLDALKKDVRVPDSDIKVMVHDGWLTLEGVVDSHYKREAAEEAVKYIDSVRGIANHITIRQGPNSNGKFVKANQASK